MGRKLRSGLFLLLKVAAAVGILIWLIANKKLTGRDFQPVLEHWGRLPICLALLACIPLIGGLRWRLLLAGQGFAVSYRRALHLTLVGIFFNCVGVGYTGGDVAKAYYAACDQPPGRRAEAVTTVLVDRLVGMVGLLLLGLLAVACRAQAVWTEPKLRTVTIVMLIGVGAIAAAFTLSLTPWARTAGNLFNRIERLSGGAMFLRITQAVMVYRRQPKTILMALGLSLAAHTANIACLWQLAQALDMPSISAVTFAFCIATGLAISSIGPPLGIGFGQGAFAFMLQPAGVTIGAALATLMQGVNLFFYLLVGLPAFLFVRKETARVKAEMAEDEAASTGGTGDAHA